ncbi:type IV secretion protein Rhs [Salmonella enterica]
MIYNSNRGVEGTLRRLTSGEIKLLAGVFGKNINSSIIWVRKESLDPFGFQLDDYGMTPFGDMYVRDLSYSDDYSLEIKEDQHFFVHEMTHSFQFQHGMKVWFYGLGSSVVDYMYRLSKGKLLSEFHMEQQASIVADYFYLKNYGEGEFLRLKTRNYIGIIDSNTLGYIKIHWLDQGF